MECIRRYEPAIAAGLARVAAPGAGREQAAVLDEVYPALRKVSVDFAVMEPASRDPAVPRGGVPMPLEWLDVGSWPMFAETCPRDEQGNALAAPRHVLVDSRSTLVASSDPRAPDRRGRLRRPADRPHARRHAGLPRRPGRGDQMLYGLIGERFGGEYL